MPQTADRWTADRVRALPDDGNRYEVIDGELFVTPSPTRRHQRAVAAIQLRLSPYVRTHGIGEALHSPADIARGQGRFVQPDVFVAPLTADGRKPVEWPSIPELLLAVEVLSPSSARADRHDKRRVYQEEGVGEYWIVDLDARVIERWTPGDQRPDVIAERLTWQPAAGAAPFELDLPAFFAEVLDR